MTMRMNKMRSVTAALLLAALLLAAPFQIPAGAFADAPGNQWYSQYLDPLTRLEIVTGYGDGTVRPEGQVTRGEFLKMLAVGSELFTMKFDTNIHWAQVYWQMAYEAEILYTGSSYSTATLFPCTAAALDTPITRYEMAMLVANTMTSSRYESRVTVLSPATNIKDYSSAPDLYKDAVEQSYGKGVINGYEDGSFQGARTLTRAESWAVIYRLLWSNERKMASFAVAPEKPNVDPPTAFTSFATRYAGMSQSQRRTELFGSAEKTYFTSAADAAPYMVDVTVPAWRIVNGQKTPGQITLTVHKLVEQEVRLIFNEIYNDPEQFPIISWGGARFSDNMRHSWGCAIDLNANENYYCRVINGVATPLVGSFWNPADSMYSIKPNGSVVRAFAKYGWGWGGQGWSGGYYDYMHFSILSSGG